MKKSALGVKSRTVNTKYIKRFRDLTKNSYEYLCTQPERAEEIKHFVQDLYARNVLEDDIERHPEVLPEIVIDGMDEEQIWQQIELHNNAVWDKLISGTSQIIAQNEDKFALNLKGHESEDDTILDDGELQEDEEEMGEEEEISATELSDEEEEGFKETKKRTKKGKQSIVDDKFFKLSEMEDFLRAEDERGRLKMSTKANSAGDGVNYFNGNLSDEGEENVNYRDFFDDDGEDEDDRIHVGKAGDEEIEEHAESQLFPEDEVGESGKGGSDSDGESLPSQEEVQNDLNDPSYSQSEDEDSDQSNDHPKSSHQLRQERLRKRIEDYEEEILEEKPWQLKGEIIASGRPQNSLLEEVLEFDSTTRPAPVITEETTQRLEDIVKQRIKDKAWDDVERKVKPVKTPQEFRKQLILDQEKSKESLAQIYEKEYQKAVEKLDPNRGDNEEEPKEHNEIRQMMKSLFNKLDALSNFHYTPKPVAPEPKIITNTPALNMEEVAPIAVSDAKLLAPEEIKQHNKGDVLGKSERTRTDKNRERRKKKTRQRAMHKAKEEKLLEKQKLGLKITEKEEKGRMLKAVMKNKNVKKVEQSTDGTSLKSSKAFFTHLQDKTSSKAIKTSRRQPPDGMTAKRLKL